jgi:AcrR family transcriptional regulator
MRSDAIRNQARVLAAAERLLADDPGGTTMESIAREAGVGKATLYRRYPDKSSIAAALLSEHERELQEELIRGEPPLGPGAPPSDRLVAFYEAYTEFLEHHGHLSRAIETSGERLRTGAHAAWRQHVASLIKEAKIDADANLLAEQLLAPLAPELYEHERRNLRRSRAKIVSSLRPLASLLDRP